ncbi:MAG: DUF2807 domain-containing protein [Muribaculaceae bacterium]|nr:DUF2807 domain-containing protein [Muribaculaceae bacterium]
MKLRQLILFLSLLLPVIMFGRENDYEVNLGQFDRLEIEDNVNVIYRCVPDSTGYAAWSGEERFADAFIFSNNKGKLRIQVQTDDVDDPALPVLHLYSDFMTQVSTSSALVTRIEEPAPNPSFKATLIGNGTLIVHGINCTKLNATLNTGNGQITLTGTAREAKYKMVGTGTIQADMLEAQRVKCNILGSGSIGCWPVESLSVSGIGSTKIYYRGTPDVSKSGGGKLFRLDATEEDPDE